jgi:hypothetical protein
MGKIAELRCTVCDYFSTVRGLGGDRGMYVALESCICNRCRLIVDVKRPLDLPGPVAVPIDRDNAEASAKPETSDDVGAVELDLMAVEMPRRPRFARDLWHGDKGERPFAGEIGLCPECGGRDLEPVREPYKCLRCSGRLAHLRQNAFWD